MTQADLDTLKGRSDEVQGLVGPALRRALVDAADRILVGLLGDPGPGVVLLAVGGYGRREPAFGSDLDLVLIYDPKRAGGRDEVAAVADRVWYPLWDAHIELDHSVRTVDEAVAVADGDLKAALGLLDARVVAGEPAVARGLIERVRERWRAQAAKRLPELAAMVADRADRFGEVPFLLEPDLKESRGGLRDVHALWQLAAAQRADPPAGPVLEANDLLLDVRGELHRRTLERPRGEDRLLMQEQEPIAEALGMRDADELARTVADAGRAISWAWDTTWPRVAATLRPPSRWRRGRPERRPLGEDAVEQTGEVQLARDAAPDRDPVVALRVAAAAAKAGLPIATYALERLARDTPPLPEPWPDTARDTFVSLLATGSAAVPVLEALDQVGLMVRLLPEWERVRSKPQRNPYHRFTVDRHLVEAAAGAAALTRRVDRPDLLLLGAFLHDMGKGYVGDHTETGIEVVGVLGPRIGLVPADADTLVALVRHHLLLPEMATRRDVSDPATAEKVAEAVGSTYLLGLLHGLTEADARATGPTAWTSWKAGLVRELVDRTSAVLGGDPIPPPPALTAEQKELLARTDGVYVSSKPVRDEMHQVVVTGPDTGGLFSAATGVVALRRLDVRRASAHTDGERALIELAVAAPHGDAPEPARLRGDLIAALDGRLDLEERLVKREEAYAGRPRKGPEPQPPEVRFDDTLGGAATMMEVRAPDGAGVLHRISRVIAETGLVLDTAIVATLGRDVIDTFYLLPGTGSALSSTAGRTALADRVLAALDPS